MSESQAAVGSSDTALMAHTRPRGPGRAVATIGALGVVFGDIGTSPIYTIQTIFNPGDPHPVAASTESVYGLLSLVFWSVTIIVTVLYVGLVLRADNEGEGGILSLITLLSRRSTTSSQAPTRMARWLATLGIFGGIVVSGRQHDHPSHFGAFGG
jgi:KUP system potassium uptake protein